MSVFFVKSKFPDGIHFTDYKDLVGYTMLGDKTDWYSADFKKFGVDTIWGFRPSPADRASGLPLMVDSRF